MRRNAIATFLPKVLDAHTYDEDTVLVGHSGGAALLLSILERLDVVVPQAFLVAGYSTQPNTEDEPVLRESYHWRAIRSHVRDLFFLSRRPQGGRVPRFRSRSCWILERPFAFWPD